MTRKMLADLIDEIKLRGGAVVTLSIAEAEALAAEVANENTDDSWTP